MASQQTELSENAARVRERIARAAARARRSTDEITIVAACKMQPAEKIREAYDAGIRHFGENRIQEREAKLAKLADLDICWHMIGHLQRNKAARAARLFANLDSLDSLELGQRLARARAENAIQPEMSVASGRHLRVLIEVKLDPEPAKTGVSMDQVSTLAEQVRQLPHLELCGLMGIAPLFDEPEDARPYFRQLRELRDELQTGTGTAPLTVLSMGMSGDLEIAIEEGATEVRVGTALFGERAHP